MVFKSKSIIFFGPLLHDDLTIQWRKMYSYYPKDDILLGSFSFDGMFKLSNIAKESYIVTISKSNFSISAINYCNGLKVPITILYKLKGKKLNQFCSEYCDNRN